MSVKEFSDIPYYMLTDYFNNMLSISSTSVSADQYVVYNDITFENVNIDWDSSFQGFFDFFGLYDRIESKSYNSRLIGPKTTIISKGSRWTKLYAKIENYGYKQIKVKPFDTEPWLDENWLKFDKEEYNDFLPGIWNLNKVPKQTHLNENPDYIIEDLSKDKYSVVKREYSTLSTETSGSSSWFKVWKKNILNEEVFLESGVDVFIRKDSYFHDWFKKNLKYASEKDLEQWDHKNFLNDEVLFLYVGTIWRIMFDETKWQILFRNIKDFMIEAIPTNDMDVNLKTFTWELFDRSYQETYNMEKNIKTLLDPEEIDFNFLGYLSKFYNVDLDQYVIDNDKQRNYIKNLPTLLKKKGTYNALFVLWKTLLGNKNSLNVYELWHKKSHKEKITSFNFKNVEEID